MEQSLIASVAAAIAVFVVFLGLHRLLTGDLDISRRLAGYTTDRPIREAAAADRSTLGERVNSALNNRSFTASLQRDLARANVRLTVGEYLLLHAAGLAGGALLGYLAMPSVVTAVFLGFVGLSVPRMYVRVAQRQRLNAFNNQLADTIGLMGNSLRAGFSLLQAMETVSREAQPPTAEEFGRVVREVSLGLSPEDALANLVRRMESEDLDMMVTAINVQHEVGGNLARILDSIAETIRERVRIRGEIRSLTAQQRLSGYVITLLPVVLGGAMYLMNPAYIGRIFTFQVVGGIPLILMPVVSAVFLVLGFVVIQKIVAIEV